MPICKKCECEFPNRIKIDGKIKQLGNRSYCLDCSPIVSAENSSATQHETPVSQHKNPPNKPKPILSLDSDNEEYITKEVIDPDLNYHFKVYNTGRVELVTNVPLKISYNPNGGYEHMIFNATIRDYKKVRAEILAPYLEEIKILKERLSDKDDKPISVDTEEIPF